MVLKCEVCGRDVYGLWKYMSRTSGHPYCSKVHFRELLRKGIITYLEPGKGYKELGIVDSRKEPIET